MRRVPSDPIAEEALGAALGPIVWVACPILFVAAFLLRRIEHPGAEGASLAILIAAITLSALALWWWRHPPRHAHRGAAAVIAILQVALIGQLIAMREPVLATFQVILAIGTAAFLIDLRWLLGLQAFGLALWLIVTGVPEPTPQWQLTRFVVVIGFLAAGAFHFGRRRSFAWMRSLSDASREVQAAGQESQEALRTSERRLRDAQRIAHVGSFEWNIERDELIWSDEHFRIFGWERGSDISNDRVAEAVHPDDRERIARAVTRSLQHGDPVEVEYRFQRPDGEERVVYGRGETIRDAAGRPVRHVGTSYDITDQHRGEEALRASESRLTTLLTAMDAARAVVVRRDGVIGSLLGTEDRTGRYGIHRSEVTGKSVHDFLPGEAGDRLRDAVSHVYATGDRTELEESVEFPNGVFHFDVSLRALRSDDGEVESVLAIVRDMTEQREEAEARRQAQKLESLGILAGGIAHDFNNLLVGILNNAETAIETLDGDSPVEGELRDIYQASVRAADLTQELLTYAGDARLSSEPLDLRELTADLARLMRTSLPDGVRVELNGENDAPWVCGDAAQIRQVVMNFISNAAEASADSGGAVTVRVDAVEMAASDLAGCYLREGLEPGSYGRVEVTDRGSGMDRRTLESVFDPFFTTKVRGRGLGLASTIGIVRAHGGTLRVASSLGGGSRFEVLFPRVSPVDEPAETPKSRSRSGRASILVIDDEDLVRTAVRRILTSAGHDVLDVTSGAEAIAALEQAPAPFDLAVIDVTMPHMDGEETLDALRTIESELPAIFMSGHSSETIARRVAGKPRATSIKKPFRRDELLDAIAALLKGAP